MGLAGFFKTEGVRMYRTENQRKDKNYEGQTQHRFYIEALRSKLRRTFDSWGTVIRHSLAYPGASRGECARY
jgi:hypothetical protein